MIALAIFVFLFLVLWGAAWLGTSVVGPRIAAEETRENFRMLTGAALTLLGLIIGFSFSMATNRYDQRKNYEESEANAIGTEYLRVGLLPAADATQVRLLLREYLDERVEFYRTRDPQRLQQIDARTAQTQKLMWSAVQTAALAQPDVLKGPVVTGMNDVLNSQSYTQAAWWNRIPPPAWALMILVAILGNVMVGIAFSRPGHAGWLLVVLPMLISIALFLIADLDSPRGGVIKVSPENLLSLAASLR